MSDPATAAPCRTDTDTDTDTDTGDVVTYTAVLPMPRGVVQRVANLLAARRLAVGTREGRRALSCWEQAVAFCRWMLHRLKVADLRVDLGIALSTTYDYLHEALAVVAAQAPSLHGALLAAHAAGHTHVSIDGTLIDTDRVSIPGPTTKKTRGKTRRKASAQDLTTKPEKVDLWWSGKHARHGGNIQMITAPDGWPLWVSPVRPGREHDVTCARTHTNLLATLREWVEADHAVLGDLGYQGERDLITCPVKAPTDGELDEATKAANHAHNGVRARAEAGNAWLKMRFAALRRVSINPWKISAIASAALVLLHLHHDRTT